MSNSPDPAEPNLPDASPQHESWATSIEHGIEEIRTQSAGVLFLDVIKIDLPYIVMLSTAVLGIGIVTFTGQPVAYYWEFLTPVYCAICIYIGWRHTETTHERTRLVWTQILHWAAFLFGMWLIYSPPLRKLIDVNAAGLNLMVLLAVATFVAGVHAAAWQICVVGIILGMFRPRGGDHSALVAVHYRFPTRHILHRRQHLHHAALPSPKSSRGGGDRLSRV